MEEGITGATQVQEFYTQIAERLFTQALRDHAATSSIADTSLITDRITSIHHSRIQPRPQRVSSSPWTTSIDGGPPVIPSATSMLFQPMAANTARPTPVTAPQTGSNYGVQRPQPSRTLFGSRPTSFNSMRMMEQPRGNSGDPGNTIPHARTQKPLGSLSGGRFGVVVDTGSRISLQGIVSYDEYASEGDAHGFPSTLDDSDEIHKIRGMGAEKWMTCDK